MRNVLAHAGKSGRGVVSAFIATAFGAASVQWRAVAGQIGPKVPKLATIMEDAETGMLAYMTDAVHEAVRTGESHGDNCALTHSARHSMRIVATRLAGKAYI